MHQEEDFGNLQHLHRLDSFIIEPAQTNHFEAIYAVSQPSDENEPKSSRLVPASCSFTFFDGLRISTGDWTYTAMKPPMNDGIEGFRFSDADLFKLSKFKETSGEWMFWRSAQLCW